jgi:hypothetical protein
MKKYRERIHAERRNTEKEYREGIQRTQKMQRMQ